MSPQEIVDKMMEGDEFSRHLGFEIVELSKGKCTLKCVVKEFMLNGHRIAHGGISYAIADSALAFASNSYGNKAVSFETSISHLSSVKEKDVLFAETFELKRGRSIGTYKINVKNQENELIATFKGSVKISSQIWE